MNEKLFGTGKRRDLSGCPLLYIKTISIFTSIYLIASVFAYPEQILHRSLCLGLFFSMIFLKYSSPGCSNTKKINLIDAVLSVVSLCVSIYIGLNLERLTIRLPYVSEVSIFDSIFAIATVLILLEGTRRIIGPWISIFSLLALIYSFAGQFIPGQFGHHGFSLDFMVDNLFLTSDGIWGSAMGVASNQVIIFIIFGSFFLHSGAGDFIFAMSSKMLKNSKGGVAKIAVATSAMFGMISGSAISNASTMGSLTIPAMKRQGYSPEFAASIESCSSVGGIFMPPVMGSVAFVMADVIGIPYIQVAYSALFPAFLYFFAIFMIIDIKTPKSGFTIKQNLGDSKVLGNGILSVMSFILPLVYLIARLSIGISPSRVGVESILLLIAINFKTMNMKKIARALIEGIDRGTMIIATMATSGILIGVITTTGISSKFSSFLISLSGQSVFLTLLLVMFLALFLGLAMNITPSYLLTAVMTVPIMVKLGIEPLSAHMFILFFSAMATITPPVAATAFAAATIADAHPMKVGFLSMRMGIIAYLLPFLFIYNPSILLIGSAGKIATTFILSIISVIILTISLEGDRKHGVSTIPVRIILLISSCMIATNKSVFPMLGLMACSFTLLFSHYKMSNLNKEDTNESA